MRRLDLTSYTCAEDFFEAVRDASRERSDILGTIASMERREGVRAQGYEALGRSGRPRDRMAATDARIDYERSRASLLAEDDAIIRVSSSLIWGGDGGDLSGGVASLAGERVATAMEMRYVQARSWGEVAALMGYSRWSKRSLRRLCEQGFNCIDSLGWARAVGGEGTATD